MVDKRRNRETLASSQYKTANNLNARWNLYNYCVPKLNIYTKALNDLDLHGDESILEVGCGDGSVLLCLRKDMQHTGWLSGLEINDTIVKPTVDYLANHPELGDVNFVVGTADRLPFGDTTQDVVLAFFMLYHMPDIQHALTEWKRVLRPGGKLLVSTASRFSRPRGKELKQKLALAAGVQPQAKFSEPFDLENAEGQLSRVFKVTERFIYEGEMRIPDAEIYMQALDSTRDMYDPLPSDDVWQRARATVKDFIEHEISTKGYFADYVKRGYFICE